MDELARMLETLTGLEEKLDKLDAADPGAGKTMDSSKNTVDWDAKLSEMDGIIAGLEKMRDGIEAAEPEEVDWAGALAHLGQSVEDLTRESSSFAQAVASSSYHKE